LRAGRRIFAYTHPPLPPRSKPEIDAVITAGGYELAVLDNCSTLIRSGKENEGDSWLPAQSWALAHRRAGRSIVFVHHDGKGGQQRGTSHREEISIDSLIACTSSHNEVVQFFVCRLRSVQCSMSPDTARRRSIPALEAIRRTAGT
jgi:hypothetical protein